MADIVDHLTAEKTCLRVLKGRLQYTGDFFAILAAILSANSNGL